MFAAIATLLAALLLVLLFGAGALAALAGAVVAVVASPTDRPIEIPVRFAGVALATLGLIVFVVALLTLIDLAA